MFTGIVEGAGTVVRAGNRLVVRCSGEVGGGPDAGVGASIAVSGVCLTVVERTVDGPTVVLAFDLSDETLARTTLGRVRPGDRVNLERPLRADGRLGGHLVQGHVDGVGTVESTDDVVTGREMSIRLPDGLGRFVAEKGSVTVDGVSLTVTGIQGDRFGVALIPFTLEETTLGGLRAGDEVNLEVDVVARYVDRLLGADRG